MIIRTSPYFDRKFRKLPPSIKRKAILREQVFLKNPFDPRLKTHKLHGKKKEEWAYWIDYHYRIFFIFIIHSPEYPPVYGRDEWRRVDNKPSPLIRSVANTYSMMSQYSFENRYVS